MSTPEERKSKIADEMESEINRREEALREDERVEQEDLNQGTDTGTHDSTRLGVNWPASYRSRSRTAESNPVPKKEENDPNAKP
jgi:hypothetical protein